uniref:Uncharacterized protein n=1 Tax=Mucochytrium quahogii TaxID=96639 RepID=A0A7S2WPM6_9STRA|mmetsp:Transcript_5999/g.13472  ORF Transcript_5999/g.13472 Transcript_5999/m.13472 type:complete len:352 (+) Transcript_5999:197-1252(+)
MKIFQGLLILSGAAMCNAAQSIRSLTPATGGIESNPFGVVSTAARAMKNTTKLLEKLVMTTDEEQVILDAEKTLLLARTNFGSIIGEDGVEAIENLKTGFLGYKGVNGKAINMISTLNSTITRVISALGLVPAQEDGFTHAQMMLLKLTFEQLRTAMTKFVENVSEAKEEYTELRETMMSVRRKMVVVQGNFSVAKRDQSAYLQSVTDQIRLVNYASCIAALVFAPICITISVGVTEGKVIPDLKNQIGDLINRMDSAIAQFENLESVALNVGEEISAKISALTIISASTTEKQEFITAHQEVISLSPEIRKLCIDDLKALVHTCNEVLNKTFLEKRQVNDTNVLELPLYN